MRNLNLNIKETEKDPVRVVENHNSRIKEATARKHLLLLYLWSVGYEK